MAEPLAISYAIPYAKALVDNLNNQALIHQLTTQLPSKQDNLINSFADSFTTKNTKSKYNSRQFYRVIIDIGALKYSIAKFGQFQAL